VDDKTARVHSGEGVRFAVDSKGRRERAWREKGNSEPHVERRQWRDCRQGLANSGPAVRADGVVTGVARSRMQVCVIEKWEEEITETKKATEESNKMKGERTYAKEGKSLSFRKKGERETWTVAENKEENKERKINEVEREGWAWLGGG
jgi:hypothetical protein